VKKERKDNLKILLTGGHGATSAVGIMEELIRRKKDLPFSEIVWVGADQAFEGKKVETLETISLPNLGVTHYKITAGKLQRKFGISAITSFLKIPIGFFQSLIIVARIKPDIALSFGGYTALPVTFAAKLFGAKVVVHEQTLVAGRANITSSHLSDLILLSREESKKYFPKDKKTYVVGLPTTTQMAELGPKGKKSIPPVVLFLGGSRGSQTINRVLAEALPELVDKYRVIHLSGQLDFKKFEEIKNAFPQRKKAMYNVYSVIDPMRRDDVFRMADVVVGRAGAHTVSDVIVTKRPSILIPIPWSVLDEQQKNAEYAEKFGVADILNEKDLTKDSLIKAISKVVKNWELIVKRVANKKTIDINASRVIVDILVKLANEN